MGEFAGVLLQVHAAHADQALAGGGVDHQAAALGQRVFVLRDLVAFGQIGVKIVLAREQAGARHAAFQPQRHAQRVFHRLAVDHRQHAGHAGAHRANGRVGQRAG